jgi:hypothetical protein
MKGARANTVLREFLQDRIRLTDRRRKWLTDHIGAFSNAVSNRISYIDEFEGGDVNTSWAHEQDQAASALLDDVRRYKEDRLDPPAIESGLEDVITKLNTLRDSFDTIHRPDSMSQSGEDYAISDDDWAAMNAAVTDTVSDAFPGLFWPWRSVFQGFGSTVPIAVVPAIECRRQNTAAPADAIARPSG